MNKKETIKMIKTIDTTHPNNIFKDIKISADNFIDLLVKIEKDDGNYEITKKLGIKYTITLLENRTNWLEYLDTVTKKDDPCDAFLQGYYHLFK
jgi:hypothetical protein